MFHRIENQVSYLLNSPYVFVTAPPPDAPALAAALAWAVAFWEEEMRMVCNKAKTTVSYENVAFCVFVI